MKRHRAEGCGLVSHTGQLFGCFWYPLLLCPVTLELIVSLSYVCYLDHKDITVDTVFIWTKIPQVRSPSLQPRPYLAKAPRNIQNTSTTMTTPHSRPRRKTLRNPPVTMTHTYRTSKLPHQAERRKRVSAEAAV